MLLEPALRGLENSLSEYMKKFPADLTVSGKQRTIGGLFVEAERGGAVWFAQNELYGAGDVMPTT